MTAPDTERKDWRDFAHSVDVLTSAALARSDIADTEAKYTPAQVIAASRSGGAGAFRARRRLLAGGVLAACLLLIAVPVARLFYSEPLPVAGRRAAEAAGQPGLQLVLTKSSYQPGEALSFQLRSSIDCHPLVYSIGADNQVRLFDPAASTAATPGAASLRADSPLQVPAPGAASAVMTAAAPGNYTIGAVCSRESPAALGAGIGQFRDKAQQGRASFESYVADLAERDQVAVARSTYDVK
jgi:hypothetical protein